MPGSGITSRNASEALEARDLSRYSLARRRRPARNLTREIGGFSRAPWRVLHGVLPGPGEVGTGLVVASDADQVPGDERLCEPLNCLRLPVPAHVPSAIAFVTTAASAKAAQWSTLGGGRLGGCPTSNAGRIGGVPYVKLTLDVRDRNETPLVQLELREVMAEAPLEAAEPKRPTNVSPDELGYALRIQ